MICDLIMFVEIRNEIGCFRSEVIFWDDSFGTSLLVYPTSDFDKTPAVYNSHQGCPITSWRLWAFLRLLFMLSTLKLDNATNGNG